MHPRNPYNKPLDFQAYAEAYPLLASHVSETRSGAKAIDFKDAQALRHLTEAILFRDFQITLKLPEGRLCPPVPNRLNYILWLQDLLAEAPSHNVVGLDIGTGASAIYPLLACKSNPTWTFVATDVDPESLESARANISSNNLSNRITIVDTSGQSTFHPFSDPGFSCDFTMCNPPFYSSKEEMRSSAEFKLEVPNAVCTGAEVEMITPGGEVSFVSSMIEESLALKTRCRFFTSMLGKMSSVKPIVGLLRTLAVDNYGITEFVQGQTRRWAIVWSFSDKRIPDSLARYESASLRDCMPPSNKLERQVSVSRNQEKLDDKLLAILRGISGIAVARSVIPGSESGDAAIQFCVRASRDTWTRAARRKRKRQDETAGANGDATTPSSSFEVKEDSQEPDELECVVRLSRCPASSDSDRRIGSAEDVSIQQGVEPDGIEREYTRWNMVCTWTRGRQHSIFQSLWNHVSSKLTSALKE